MGQVAGVVHQLRQVGGQVQQLAAPVRVHREAALAATLQG